MKRQILHLAAAFACAGTALAQTVSVKSPDGKNEIRLSTEPTLSYSVYRGGIERVSPSPIALEIEGVGTLGGAGAKIATADTVSVKGTIDTPIYKKARVDESANRTTVTFEGGWGIVLVARNDGVAYRFTTSLPGRVKVLNEVASLGLPDAMATVFAGYCRNNIRLLGRNVPK